MRLVGGERRDVREQQQRQKSAAPDHGENPTRLPAAAVARLASGQVSSRIASGRAVLRLDFVNPEDSKRWRQRAVAISSASLLALAVAEGVLRLSGSEIYPVPLYPGDIVAERDRTYDPVIGWKLPPGETIREITADYDVPYEANAQGFRSRYDFAAPATARRIAFLGDSFTFGSGVREEETFVSVAESALAGAEPASVQALNFGIGGFGIDQMLLALEHEALPRRVDAVVLSFIRQDLDRSLSSYRKGHIWLEKPAFHLEHGALVRTTASHRPGPIASWVVQELRLSRLWRKSVDGLANRWPIGERWRLNRALFARLRDTCAAAGVPLLVVHLPVNPRTKAPLYAREFADLDIAYLDLALLLPADAESLYFPHDRHFTPAGHRFAGAAIASAIASRGLLAAPGPATGDGVGSRTTS